MNIIISVIVPIYNVEKYLKRCIDSIITQTYKNLEIILVDDGSQDNCGNICDSYSAKDTRIKVIHKVNGGLSDARNAGIDVATGQYIAFVDSDDYVASNMYEILLDTIIKNNADLSICDFCSVSESGDITLKEPSVIEDGTYSGEKLLENKLLTENYWHWVVAWNKLYKKSIFDNIRFPVGKLHEDEFLIHKILMRCKIVACVSNKLVYYVQRDSSITGEGISIKTLDKAEALLQRTVFFVENGFSNKLIYNTLQKAFFIIGNVYVIFDSKNDRLIIANMTSKYKFVAKKVIKLKGIGLKRFKLFLCIINPRFVWKLQYIKKKLGMD